MCTERYQYGAAMRLVHKSVVGVLFHLVQRGCVGAGGLDTLLTSLY